MIQRGITVLRRVEVTLRRVFQIQQPTDRFGMIDAALRPVPATEFILRRENFEPEKTFFILFSYKDSIPQNGLPLNSYLLFLRIC